MIKKLILICLILCFTALTSASDEFDYSPSQQSVTKARISKFIFEAEPTPNADILYELGYMDGSDFIKLGHAHVHIQDQEFTDLLAAINNGSNIKQTLINALKIKLGIE